MTRIATVSSGSSHGFSTVGSAVVGVDVLLAVLDCVAAGIDTVAVGDVVDGDGSPAVLGCVVVGEGGEEAVDRAAALNGTPPFAAVTDHTQLPK